MTKCRVCGELNPDGNKFCAACGARLEDNAKAALTEALENAEKEFDKDSLVSMDKSRITYVCSVCGSVNRIDQDKCSRCGKPRPRSEYINALRRIKQGEALREERATLVAPIAVAAPVPVLEPEPAPEVKFHPDDLLADLRLRILNKERALCWNMYDEGIISFVTLRCLTASLDEQYDQSGRIPLSSRKRVFNFYNNSFYTRWLKNFPLVRKWSDVYFHDKIVNGYDLARGFFITQKKSLELIDEFAHSKVLTPNETAQMDILRGEIGENIEHITAVMEEMAYDYPVSYRCGVTRKSIRMLLANERRQIEQFRSEGILSASEAGSMFDDIDERHASIGSLTKTWKRNRKLNDASRGL